jgi:predicted Zn-dependent protease
MYEECEVWTMNVVGPNDLEWLTTYHEMGHCLGLAHDDYEQSIMHPVQRPTADATIPPWISDYDRDLLRERYMP